MIKINILIPYLVILVFLNFSNIGLSGSERRNGGDALSCTATSENFYAGLYSLDYVLTVDNPIQDGLIPADSWQQSLDRIYTQLNKHFPFLAEHFKNYLNLLNNFNDYSQKRIWKGKKIPLIDIKDEDYLFKVPDNCRIKNSNKINIIQSVIRTEYDSGFVSYFYDINHFSELKNDAATPLQFSFLIIHEWLWDFFPSNKVNQLRELNYLLHSPQLDELSTADLTVIFSNLDFPKDPIMQKPNPNALNKEYLELGENMACYGKNNHLHCWGREFSKEAVRALNNVQIENISGLAIGFHHGCLIDQGKIACYGTSGYNATWGSQSQEIMQNIREPLSLYSSKDLDCALTKLDGLQCYHEERPIPFLSEPYDLVTTNEYSCAFTKHGIKCFGMIANSIKKEIEAIDLMKIVDIAGNSTNICILFSKKIECFGSSIPLKEDTPQIFNPSEIAVGKNHACVIDDGQIKCWGDNRRYQLEVPTINNPQYIRAAGDYSCTRDSVGIRCWGGGDDRALTQVPQNLYPLQID